MSGSLVALTMPKWGLTMTEGKVTGWLREAGDAVAPGDELLEIETSKITNVVEAERDTTLLRIVAPAGTTAPIGALLAVLGPPDTDPAEVDRFVSGFEVVAATEEEAAVLEPVMIEAGPWRMRILDQGSGGTPVLLLHGFAADLNAWMFVQPALAIHRRVLALDLPGHGASAKQVGAGDAAVMADAVLAAMDALGLKRAHLVGHSLGGGVAAAVAMLQPARVASLALIAPAGFGPDINAGFIDGLATAERRKDIAALLALLVADPSLVSRAMVDDVLRYKRLDGVADALRAIANAWFPGGSQHFSAAPLAGLAMPLQVIWGAEDRIIPATHARAIPRAEVHVLPGTGHLPHMEHAADVTRLIERFLAS
jgi:pyruvate dehydrogenase E2 component (dihydrolipoamide acetyltransferase)